VTAFVARLVEFSQARDDFGARKLKTFEDPHPIFVVALAELLDRDVTRPHKLLEPPAFVFRHPCLPPRTRDNPTRAPP
jgi:hypothetical protein